VSCPKSQLSRIEHIVFSGRGGDCKGILVASLTFYIDDSGTSPREAIAVAAGWIAPIHRWKKFEIEWSRVKEKEGFACFHAAECVASNPKSEFASWDYPKKLGVVRRLRQLIRKYASCGLAIGITKADYDKFVTGGLRERAGKDHYTFAVRGIVGMVENWRERQSIAARSHPTEYVFDWMEPKDRRRKEIDSLFGDLEKEANADARYGLYQGCYSFRRRCDVLPLQASDLLAWAVRQRSQASEAHPMTAIAVETFNELASFDDGRWLEAVMHNPKSLETWAKKKVADPC
jgi:hypothetical protein